MPRVSPISHLLRNLNNAAALRRNGLSARFFEGLGSSAEDSARGLRRVHTALRKALTAMEQPSGLLPNIHERRRAAIIRSCEFEGVPQKKVASDLGISRRHFYRELAAARAAFAERFAAIAITQEPEVHSTIDVFELQLQRLRMLKQAGNFEQALVAARGTLAAIGDDDRKFEVLHLLAELHADSGHLEPLLDLEHELMQLERHRFPVSRKAVLAVIRTLQARALWMQGRPDSAAAMCRPEIFYENSKLGSTRERSLWASALLESALFRAFIGHYEIAAPQILLARDLIRDIERPAPMLRFRLLLGLADLNLTAQGFAEAKENLKRGYQVAAEHNLISAALDATLTLGTAQMLDGDASAAIENARSAVAALSEMPIADKQWHLLMAAQIEAGCKNTDRALEVLAQIHSRNDEDAMLSWLVQAMEAECYSMQRRYSAAARKALSASRGFRKAGVLRGLGYSLRVAAEAQAGMGNTAGTREYITESVELLERYGHRRSLAKALELSGRLTGNRSHARRAKELLAPE